MKKLLLVMLVIGAATSAPAQGSFQFTANLTPVEPLPPFPVISRGEGMFTLEGNTFRYRVDVTYYAPWTSQIRGPGVDGPALFDLTLAFRNPPLETNLGSVVFRGTIDLPDAWVADLMADRWYVTAMYRDISADVHLRGQVMLVPEPAPFVLLGLFGTVFALRAWFRRRGDSPVSLSLTTKL